MSTASEHAKSGFLAGLAAIIHGSTKAAQPASSQQNSEYEHSAQELDSAMKSLKSKIEKQREAIAIGSSVTFDTSALSEDSARNLQEVKQKELDRSITQMQASISEIQSMLGLLPESKSAEEIEEYLIAVIEQLKGDDLDARIRQAILQRVHLELGEISWKLLMNQMEHAGLKWPEPGGIIPGASDEQIANAVAYRLSEAHQLFVSQKLESSIKSMKGSVSAWKTYPEKDSWLWREVALRGAACYVRCSLMQAAVEKLRSEGDSLRASANKLIEENISKIQSLLTSGVRSLEDAEKVVQGTDAIVQNLLPDLAWQSAMPTVKLEISKLTK